MVDTKVTIEGWTPSGRPADVTVKRSPSEIEWANQRERRSDAQHRQAEAAQEAQRAWAVERDARRRAVAKAEQVRGALVARDLDVLAPEDLAAVREAAEHAALVGGATALLDEAKAALEAHESANVRSF